MENNHVLSSDHLNQVEQQLDIFVTQLSQTKTHSTTVHSERATARQVCHYSTKRGLSTYSQFGSGTEEYQLSLFDDLEPPQSTSLHSIDDHAIINDKLDEFMPLIGANIEQRLSAAIAQKRNAVSAKKSP